MKSLDELSLVFIFSVFFLTCTESRPGFYCSHGVDIKCNYYNYNNYIKLL